MILRDLIFYFFFEERIYSIEVSLPEVTLMFTIKHTGQTEKAGTSKWN